ncbi:Muramoyltetrapeptide carboxypeptidase LdcA (peptidoglycan recycling) [Micromonospora phaseoli]|uniref:Muramoyltetrapeptide carboxypeptidase LdcA (Peptidoglycan recycling) n=1 Tax=Micromonospora phaseoli TaxID=1144548 RepID=A0A1H6ZUV6_9ACTN|nr:S66 peptidase family protein [Micromonospora phaseoli]PZV97035.1 muramoyltetrapeptide carboxypeptidase LdcA involved in peptidoglycan recycling [Micromonospora phaseoli]GIJ77387.1 LD-carboxypeptidase [Micromonospora phaseoli]SEJ56436.1 Muramoyltetrapeptide carboxypeptidase LdcA (peptidoglycan recycling) [Micromonospora phaseoli]
MSSLSYPPKPRPGDRVAVVSPSAGLPGLFPHVYELGLHRLREEYRLEPEEYPTTRIMGADPRDRARDLTAAFADPTVTAVLATVGGDDLITVTPHLDDAVLRANPKPYFGYSDNTNVLNHLHRLGIVGYHGGSVLVHLGRPGALHPLTADSLRAALFGSDWYDLTPAAEWGDEPGDWNDPGSLAVEPVMFPGAGWHWQGPATVVTGRTWGGNLEVLHWLLAADRVAPAESLHGSIFLIETSEELPPAVEVYRMLRNLGERGLLAGFPAALVGRAKAWEFSRRLTPQEKTAYAGEQRAAVTRAFAEYAPDALLVFDVDFGHTDPQLIIPYGGEVRVDAVSRRISVRY